MRGANFLVPTAEGVVDAVEVLQQKTQAGEWVLIAPDGRTWFNANPMILFAVLAATMRGEKLTFDLSGVV
jgi:hypothetical protein